MMMGSSQKIDIREMLIFLLHFCAAFVSCQIEYILVTCRVSVLLTDIEI